MPSNFWSPFSEINSSYNARIQPQSKPTLYNLSVIMHLNVFLSFLNFLSSIQTTALPTYETQLTSTLRKSSIPQKVKVTHLIGFSVTLQRAWALATLIPVSVFTIYVIGTIVVIIDTARRIEQFESSLALLEHCLQGLPLHSNPILIHQILHSGFPDSRGFRIRHLDVHIT